MVKIVDHLALWCIIDMRSSPQTWKIKLLDFIDEHKLYINIFLRNVRESITETMEVSTRTWNALLNFVGENLETRKCEFFVIK